VNNGRLVLGPWSTGRSDQGLSIVSLVKRHLIYSHDTYGLGHYRRCALLASALVQASDQNDVLIVTGSPRAESFSLPDRVDTVKLPAVTKNANGAYVPRTLGGGLRRLIEMRSSVISSLVDTYEPDVLLVDHAPVGMGGELTAVFDKIMQRRSRPRLVLGLRDIVDDASRTDLDWTKTGAWNYLRRYDEVLVYGDRRVLTTADELNLSSRISANVTHTGYVAPNMNPPSLCEPFLLVTPGGGGDAMAMLERFLDAVDDDALGSMRSVIVAGPLLSFRRYARLLDRVGGLASVELIDFAPNMRDLVGSATAVVSMAGYNTVVEELAAGVPSLVVPRCSPRLEQTIRAQRLAPLSALEHCTVEELTGRRLASFVDDARSTGRSAAPLDLNGAREAARVLSGPVVHAPDRCQTPRTAALPPTREKARTHV
jgi:predicted glycosyltransferase